MIFSTRRSCAVSTSTALDVHKQDGRRANNVRGCVTYTSVERPPTGRFRYLFNTHSDARGLLLSRLPFRLSVR